MTPRLTAKARKHHAHSSYWAGDRGAMYASRPSPAERLRQRRKAMAARRQWGGIAFRTFKHNPSWNYHA